MLRNVLIATLLCLPLASLPSGAAAQFSSSVPFALPPMGWSSWNSFSNTINSNVTVAQAKALHSSGLQKAGYQYVNIDEGWWLGERDAEGNIVVDPKMWPALQPGERDGDMSNIVRYIHSLGLKAGIYTDVGLDGCSIYPDIGPAYFKTGSEGHYEQDFLQFARWGFDYVKVDWCGGDRENLDPDVQYGEAARAIAHAETLTGHTLYYSICEWGKQSPFTWGPGVGGASQAIWRTGDDIVAPVVAGGPHTERKVSLENMFKNFDKNSHPEAQHTGYYNDADMMVLGMPDITAEQDRLHMSLWVMEATPLLIGADLTRLSTGALATLTNADAIAIDQNPLGLEGIKVRENGPGLEIWSKFLSPHGERAVLLFNRTYFPAPMHVDWKDLGLSGGAAAVRDVWAATNVASLNDGYSATVPARDAVLLLVRGSEPTPSHVAPASTDRTLGEDETVFSGLAGARDRFVPVQVHYQNRSSQMRLSRLFVNAQTGTTVALPPTQGQGSSVWIQVRLDRPGTGNRLVFEGGHDIAFQSIDVY